MIGCCWEFAVLLLLCGAEPGSAARSCELDDPHEMEFTDAGSKAVHSEIVFRGTVRDGRRLPPLPTGGNKGTKEQGYSILVNIRRVLRGANLLSRDARSHRGVIRVGNLGVASPCKMDVTRHRTYVFFVAARPARSAGYTVKAAPVEAERSVISSILRIVCADCAKPPRLVTARDVTVRAGRRAVLRCGLERHHGNPLPSLAWFKQGSLVNDSASVRLQMKGRRSLKLLFDRVVPEDSGVYLCRASNAVGEDVAEVKLKVKRQGHHHKRKKHHKHGHHNKTPNSHKKVVHLHHTERSQEHKSNLLL